MPDEKLDQNPEKDDDIASGQGDADSSDDQVSDEKAAAMLNREDEGEDGSGSK